MKFGDVIRRSQGVRDGWPERFMYLDEYHIMAIHTPRYNDLAAGSWSGTRPNSILSWTNPGWEKADGSQEDSD